MSTSNEPRGTATPRVCGALIEGQECGAQAVAHIFRRMATETRAETIYVCREHYLPASRGPVLQTHPIGADCGMPGFQWSIRRNKCECPGEEMFDEGQEVRDLELVE